MTVAPRMFVAEDRQQILKRGFHSTGVTNVAPVDGGRFVAEVVIGKLLQPRQLGLDGCGAGKVGIDGDRFGIHRGLRG